MAKIDGNLFRIKISGVPIGATTDVSYSMNKDVQETTNQDDSGLIYHHATCGKLSAKGTFAGFYDPDGTLNAEELVDRIVNNSGFATVQVGQATGIYWQFSALFSDVSIETKNDTVTTVKGSFASSGAVTKIDAGAAPTVPTISTATVYDANNILIVFSDNMINPAAYLSDFALKINGSDATETAVAHLPGWNDEYLLTVSDTITTGQTVTLSITSGNIASTGGGVLATVTDLSVTNGL